MGLVLSVFLAPAAPHKTPPLPFPAWMEVLVAWGPTIPWLVEVVAAKSYRSAAQMVGIVGLDPAVLQDDTRVLHMGAVL